MPGSHGSGCGCRHDSDESEGGYWLDEAIDKQAVAVSGGELSCSMTEFLRPWDSRLNDAFIMRSCDEDDPEIVLIIPFASPTKITGITVIGGGGGQSPQKVKLFANVTVGDFIAVHDMPPTQEVELVEDFCGAVLYPLRVSKFSNLHSLALHFPADSPLAVHWVGLKGIASGVKRQAVVTVYEARANLADHDPIIDSVKSGHIGF